MSSVEQNSFRSERPLALKIMDRPRGSSYRETTLDVARRGEDLDESGGQYGGGARFNGLNNWPLYGGGGAGARLGGSGSAAAIRGTD